MSTQYVQHISGQGEKWEVTTEWPDSWFIERDVARTNLQLPKSEYRLCEPPEVWKDIEGLLSLTDGKLCCGDLTLAILPYGFRFAWAKGHLTVEKKQP